MTFFIFFISYNFSRHGTTANIPDIFGINDMMIMSLSTMHSCQDLEINAWECMEYYGEKRGAVICRDHYDDFVECTHQNIQVHTNFSLKIHVRYSSNFITISEITSVGNEG